MKSGKFETEKEAKDELKISWDHPRFEHCINRFIYFSELLPKKYFD